MKNKVEELIKTIDPSIFQCDQCKEYKNIDQFTTIQFKFSKLKSKSLIWICQICMDKIANYDIIP